MKAKKMKAILWILILSFFLGSGFITQTSAKDKLDIVWLKKGYENLGYCSEGLIAASKRVEFNDMYGYIDKNGKEVIPFKYEEAYNFSEGLAAVRKNYKWGFINKRGKNVTAFKYDIVESLCEGIACVRIGKKMGDYK